MSQYVEAHISGVVFELNLKNHWIFSGFVEKNKFSNLWRTVSGINVVHLYKQIKIFYFSLYSSEYN